MFKQRKKWLRLFFLHRYTGLIAAFFAIVLSVTGLLLNHTEAFGLSHKMVSIPWLMRIYGIQTSEVTQAFLVNDSNDNNKSWVIEYDSSLYLSRIIQPRHSQTLECATPLSGAVKTDELLITVATDQVCLFTHKGELVDQIRPAQGKQINRLGKSKGGAVILQTSGGYQQLNPDMTGFASLSKAPSSVHWSAPSHAPASIISPLKQLHKGAGLPLERIILDLHSGRIVGLAGVYFMDIVAMLLIFLASSGFIMWFRRKQRHKQGRAK